MPTIDRTVTTTADPQAVWDYMSDFTNTDEWDPGTVRTVRIAGTGGVGTTYENTSRFAGREVQVIYTVVESHSPTVLQLRGENDSVTLTDTMTFTPMGSGTKLRYHAQFDFKGVLGRVQPLFSLPLLNLPFKRLGDEAEREIKRVLDRL